MMNGGFGVFLAALKTWSPLIGALATIIFMAGANYKSLQDLTNRVDRIEAKVDQVIMGIKK